MLGSEYKDSGSKFLGNKPPIPPSPPIPGIGIGIGIGATGAGIGGKGTGAGLTIPPGTWKFGGS
jgi:hypothetical protein